MFDEQVNASERRSEPAHGFLVRERDGLAGGDADIFLKIGDEGDESDAVQRGGFAEETGGGVGLFQGRLAELAAEGGKTAKHEGEGLFAVKHGGGERRFRGW